MMIEMLKTLFNTPDVSGGKSSTEFFRDSGKRLILVLGIMLIIGLAMSTNLMAVD